MHAQRRVTDDAALQTCNSGVSGGPNRAYATRLAERQMRPITIRMIRISSTSPSPPLGQ